MSDSLHELYQEIILDHNRHPRNFNKITPCNHQAYGHNPLCGDQVTVYLFLNPKNMIENVGFNGKGCAISIASASLMTEKLKGKSVPEARQLFEHFHNLVTGKTNKTDLTEEELDYLQPLTVLSGVSEFPMRVKCATMAWHTLVAAIDSPALPTIKNQIP